MSKLFGIAVLTLSFLSGFLQLSIAQSPDATDTIRKLEVFRELGEKSVGRKVDFEATVTFVEPYWDYIFVQENDHAVFIHNPPTQGFESGDRVRVRGIGRDGDVDPFILADSVDRLGPGSLPTPLVVKLSNLELGDLDGRFIRVQGNVLQAVSSIGHTLLVCEERGTQFHVCLLGARSLDQLYKWVGTRIKLDGVLGITLEGGSENLESQIGNRKVQSFRVQSNMDPRFRDEEGKYRKNVERAGPPKPQPEILEGQISTRFNDCVVLLHSQKLTRIACRDSHSIEVGDVVQIAVVPIEDEENDFQYQALVVESMFRTRLPRPIEFHHLAEGKHLWKHVKASGQPTNIRAQDKLISFDIVREGKTAHVELHEHGFNNVNMLQSTRSLEVRGTITHVDPEGNCQIVVQNASDISLTESVMPIWKYVAWALLPITGLFLVGFVWVKRQRNRAASFAASIEAMHSRLTSAYQAINDGMLSLDNNDCVLTVNSQFCKLLEKELKSGEKFETQTCETFLQRTKNRKQVERLIFENAPDTDTECQIEIEGPNSETRSFDFCCSDIVSDAGETTGRLLIFRDQTHERQLQAELIRANRLDAVGKLAGGVAHNFNNILTTITANLSLLKIDANVQGSAIEKIDVAEVAVARGSDLVRRLLTYSGKAQLNPQPHSINTIIRELHKFSKATFDSRFTFEFDLDDQEPRVHVDAGAIEQVILNLFLNARDAMQDGGTIRTQTQVTTNGNEPSVKVIISDTGPGISEDLLDQVFTPFFTTKAGQAGTGLGLSTSKRLISEQNGELIYDSEIEGGAFVILLPTTTDTCQEMPPEVEAPVVAQQRKTVLIVDDEDSIRKSLSKILEHHGFDVLTAVNGESALAVLQTEHDRIDVVLLDLSMPGISGIEVLKIALAEYPHLPFILCSGFLGSVPSDLTNKCLMLAKPFSVDKLLATIGETFHQKQIPQNAS